MENKKQKENLKKDESVSAKEKKIGLRFSIRFKFSLAIFTLVAIIILSFAFYFINRESEILRTQEFEFAKREMIHLYNTARGAIGADELAISATIKDLKTIHEFKYAYVLNANDEIIQYFNKNEGEKNIGSLLRKKNNDGVNRKFKNKKGELVIVPLKDLYSKKEKIYDFSREIFSKYSNKKIGRVIIGLSDIKIRNSIAKTKRVIIYISFVIFVFSIIAGVVLSGIIINPIKSLSKGATIIGKGNWNYRIKIKTKDELGKLATDFNEMTEMLEKAKNQEVETKVMEEQLEVARDIQEGLNPMGYYHKDGIQIKGYTKAAKGVGGDYFDYIDIDEHRVGALISDVSGKGVPASLVMVMIRTVFTSYISRKEVDCASVVTAINDSLSADFAIDKFATLFFLIYDRRTQEVSFSNAGHGPLTVYRADKGTCTATKLDGVPIGIMEDIEYKQAKVKLNPGDIIILTTDGVTEMRNEKKDEYGLNRVLHFTVEHSDLNAEEFVNLLVKDVDDFKGSVPPHDDETMLIFKRE